MDDKRRYYSLDALRGSMMMLGIILHGSQFYISEPIGVIPLSTDGSTSYIFNIIIYFIHSFRMPLFFMLAGFFTSLLVDKHGIKGTYINRVKRIFGPFSVSLVTILPLTLLCGLAFLVSAKFNTHQFIPEMKQLELLRKEMQEAGIPMNGATFAHLWFLYYLMFFYLTIPLCMMISHIIKPFKNTLDNWIAKPAMFIVLSFFTSMLLMPFRFGQVFEGFVFVKPHLPSLIYFGSFFILGYLFHQHRKILESFKSYLPWFASLAMILFPLSLYFSRLDEVAAQQDVFLHFMAVITNGLCTWALIYTFMGIFLRYLDYESPWILYVSQSSYWVYLIHLPLVVFFAWCLLPFKISAFIKYPAIVLPTMIISLVSYHYLVQRSWVSILLNGRRFNLRWPWKVGAKLPSK